MRLRFLIPLFIFLQANFLFANPSPVYIGVSGGYGFMWAHRYNLGHLVKTHLGAVELDVWKKAEGTKSWHQPFHFPQCGIAAIYVPLGNPEQLGSGLGIYPYMNFPLGARARKIKTHLRVGWGAGWITKIFDPETNHQNNAIGSHLNTFFTLRLNSMWYVNDRMFVESGIGLSHFSNGGTKVPNLGLNIPLFMLGVHYQIKEPVMRSIYVDPRSNTMVGDSAWHVTAILVAGYNSIEPASNAKYGAYNVLTYCMKRTAMKHRFGGGVDVMWSEAILHKREAGGDTVSFTQNIQPGVKFCYELVLGRLSWPMEVGVYLHSPLHENGYVYNRSSIHYQINKHLVASMGLKSHLAKAEYWELGAGWRF